MLSIRLSSPISTDPAAKLSEKLLWSFHLLNWFVLFNHTLINSVRKLNSSFEIKLIKEIFIDWKILIANFIRFFKCLSNFFYMCQRKINLSSKSGLLHVLSIVRLLLSFRDSCFLNGLSIRSLLSGVRRHCFLAHSVVCRLLRCLRIRTTKLITRCQMYAQNEHEQKNGETLHCCERMYHNVSKSESLLTLISCLTCCFIAQTKASR